MDVLHPHHPPSRLNPNAPIFVPMRSYQTVEDFSDQWWDLVHSSPFFRDYWLHDCFDETSQTAPPPDHLDDLALADFDAFVDLYLLHQQEERETEEVMEEKREKELISIGALKWSKPAKAESPRSFEKAPKIVKSVRANPKMIHQPR